MTPIERLRLESVWSFADCVKLCGGFKPCGPSLEDEENFILSQNLAIDSINKACLGGELTPIDPTDTQDTAHRLYNQHRYFKSDQFSQWAINRYPDFPIKFDKDTTTETSPDIGKTERSHFLKMILAAAIDTYEYEPGKEKQANGTGAAKFERALEKHGLKVDQKVIRAYLKEAETHFTPNPPKDKND
ncbi:MAG: hypothetical protein CVV06_01385 [Gammaproteobacteria bacterium HGW-Gammaproteobacteria-10]|nr:MAG: hypothetical protein CVV06_01385 [Gammaproteobacteria bacterium HGW-Gammaproteobacteria-10]